VEENRRRIEKLENCMDKVQQQLALLQGSQSTVKLLLQWVVVPLLVILGGLVGVKIAWPGA
jgi:hypothetical protein